MDPERFLKYSGVFIRRVTFELFRFTDSEYFRDSRSTGFSRLNRRPKIRYKHVYDLIL